MSLVTYNSAGNQGYLTPSATPTTKGLVLVQEAFGVDQNMKNLTHRFAAHGIHAFAPDLYHGRTANTHEEAMGLYTSLDWPMAVQEIREAAEYLKREHGCESVAVTGYCMGGALAFAVAALCKDVFSAAIPFYGTPRPELASIKDVGIPVQAHFGVEDTAKGFSDAEAAAKAEEALKESGVEFEFYNYQNAGHAFMNVDRPEMYRKESAELGFSRTVEFVLRH